METYKILKQSNINQDNFINYIIQRGIPYIQGNCKSSFGIKYDPERYRDFIADNFIFSKIKQDNVSQLIVTNEMYIELYKNSKKLGLSMETYESNKFDDYDSLFNYLDEKNITWDDKAFLNFLNKEEITITKVSYRTAFQRRALHLRNNGIIGFDPEICKEDSLCKNLKKFIDTLNFGLRVLNNV